MALKKSQIYSSLWQSCDELRGGMDASQYKDYILTLLFMKYVSDKQAGDPDALIEVPDGGGFTDMVKLKGDKEIGIGPDTRQDQTIYDPTCGSGSLLLKADDEAPRGITVYGQEMDNTTWALARMNLILHNYETAELWRGNTLAAPYFTNPNGGLKTFDFAVANPPFSAKA